jgi:N6-adenosine-specific RNA methylase IME4
MTRLFHRLCDPSGLEMWMDWPTGKYQVIVADPPWSFKTWSDKGRGRAPSYKLMGLTQIMQLPVHELAADHCALFLWCSNPLLPDALRVISAWGFDYRTVAFNWAKTTRRSKPWSPKWHMGLGYYTRSNSEQCLLGVRGAPKRLDRGVRQLIISEHSRKPDEFFRAVERLVPGPYCELFARQMREGWWGDEVDHFTPEPSPVKRNILACRWKQLDFEDYINGTRYPGEAVDPRLSEWAGKEYRGRDRTRLHRARSAENTLPTRGLKGMAARKDFYVQSRSPQGARRARWR